MMNIATSQSAKEFADGKILKGVTDGVGIVTFNNPEKRNAMSVEMWAGAGERKRLVNVPRSRGSPRYHDRLS